MDAGFSIGGEFYSFPSGFRLGDPVLVAEVTGLEWMDFAEMLDNGDSRTLAGLIAVAVWQKHPTWRRDKVVRFVEQIELDSIEVQAPEDDARPPEPGTTGRSPETSTGSSDEAALSEPPSLASSGALS